MSKIDFSKIDPAIERVPPDGPSYSVSDYKPTSTSDPIRCWTESVPSFADVPGWYFWNETWTDLHGPFATLEECRDALKHYAETI